MNNIEKLAIEHGSTCYTGQEYHFERWQLEAFAKALQSSEAVADVIKYVGTTENTTQDIHPNDDEPRCDDLIALMKRMSDGAGQGLHPYWQWAMATGFNEAKRIYKAPNTVSLEEHNKRIAELEATNKTLLDALKRIASETQDTNLLWWQKEARQAIADAEGVDK